MTQSKGQDSSLGPEGDLGEEESARNTGQFAYPTNSYRKAEGVEITSIVGVTATAELLRDPPNPMNSYGFLRILRILQSSWNSNYYCTVHKYGTYVLLG